MARLRSLGGRPWDRVRPYLPALSDIIVMVEGATDIIEKAQCAAQALESESHFHAEVYKGAEALTSKAAERYSEKTSMRLLGVEEHRELFTDAG